MAQFVYLLCGLTSMACAGILLRSYLSNRHRLLLWSAMCFVGLCINNVLLFVDLALLPTSIDLSPYRGMISFASMVVLIYGLVWDTV